MNPPSTSADFDRAYRAPITGWGDTRIPPELQALAADLAADSAADRPAACVLELGCGLGRLSHYMAQQGLAATGVDFSPVAIERARQRVARDDPRPAFRVADVTRLDALDPPFDAPFDAAFDVGCFHCLAADSDRRYARELARLLRPEATLLIWALDASPSGQRLSPESVGRVFAGDFRLRDARPSRRRIARSHWYRLTRAGA